MDVYHSVYFLTLYKAQLNIYSYCAIEVRLYLYLKHVYELYCGSRTLDATLNHFRGQCNFNRDVYLAYK